MKIRRTSRRRSVVVATAFLALISTSAATACDPVSRDWAWTMGKTHGAIIETTAGRGSLGIYRVPTRLLHLVLTHGGIKDVQDAIWKYGKPPALKKTFRYRNLSYTVEFGFTTSALRLATRKLIYDDPKDLESALRETRRGDSCLAITLISYGKPDSNWTFKNVGCQDGSFG